MDDFGDPEALSSHMAVWARQHLRIAVSPREMGALLAEIDNFRTQEREAIRCEVYSSHGATCIDMDGDMGYCLECRKEKNS